MASSGLKFVTLLILHSTIKSGNLKALRFNKEYIHMYILFYDLFTIINRVVIVY